MKNKNIQMIKAALFVLLLALTGMTNAFAQKFTEGKLEYSVLHNSIADENDISIWVTGHVDGNEAKGDLIIPELVSWEGRMCPVSGIWDAFGGCSGLTSVNIPTSVKIINDYAFSGCSGLTSITIPNSVETIGAWAFSGCAKLTSIEIPSSVTYIDGYAFEYCTKLASITLPQSIFTIVNNAFNNTKWYNEQPDGVLYLDNCCMGYKGEKPRGYLQINENTRLIAKFAFYDCDELTSISLPNSVISIGAGAFEDCSGLVSISIPKSVHDYGDRAFINTGWYNAQPDGALYLDDCCIGYKGNQPRGHLQIKDGTRIIANSAFESCSGLTSISIPNTMTDIGNNAFYNCQKLLSITIPNSVTSIGDGAFKSCSGLTSITIPNSVTSIGDRAFYYCTGLTSVTIPNSATKMGKDVFKGCENLHVSTEPITLSFAQNFNKTKGITELSVFHEGMAAVKNSNEKWGYINRNGMLVVPCKYDEARRFSEGLAAVKKDGAWGYIDKDGFTKIPFRYQNPYPFKDGLAYVYLDGKYVLIDTKGNVVPNMPDMERGFLPFSEGWAIVKLNYRCYFIDKQGKRVTENFRDARPFSEGLAAVMSENSSRWGFIDKSGKLVIPCQYTTARPFREGLAAVDGGYIDKSGNWVIPPKYVETTSFENGLALVIKSRSTVCVINKSGKELYSYTNEYDNFTEIMGFSNGIAAVYCKVFSGSCWLAFSTRCNMLSKNDVWSLSHNDMKYKIDEFGLLQFNNLANECLFPANKEDNLACMRRDGSKLFEKIYYYIDNQGNTVGSILNK